jgi:hypothetical protein
MYKHCQKFIALISKRAFLLKSYDELFITIYRNYDPEVWSDFQTLSKLTEILTSVAKREGFFTNSL